MKKIQLSELLYLIYIFLMLFSKGIGLYDGQILYKVFLVLAIGVLLAKFCITEHTLKEWILIIALSLLTIIVYFNCKEKGIIICILTVLAMKNVSVDKVFKTGMWTWGIVMWGNIIYHLLNLDASGYKVHEKLGLGHIFRWDLGFSHPNVLHISYFVFCGFIVYNLDKKYQWKHALGLMLGNLFIFLYSVSYTGIVVVTLYLTMSLYVNIRKEISKVEYLIMELVFPVCVLLSLLSPLLLPPGIFYILNKVFSNRLILAEYYLVSENMKLFGNSLEDITTHILTMDNAYVFSLVIYGIIIFVLILVGYFMMIHFCIKQKKTKELVLILCIVIAGITEPFLFNTSFKNLTLLFLGNFLFESSCKEIEQEKRIAIYAKGNKEIILNYQKIDGIGSQLKSIWKREKKRALVLALSCGMIISVFYGMIKEMPQGYIMPRIHVDIESDETWYLESEQESEYKNMKILDYKDAETRMQIFEGIIVGVEYIRSCISTFVITTVSVLMVYVLIINITDSKKRVS